MAGGYGGGAGQAQAVVQPEFVGLQHPGAQARQACLRVGGATACSLGIVQPQGLSAGLLAAAALLLIIVLLPSVKNKREEAFVED